MPNPLYQMNMANMMPYQNSNMSGITFQNPIQKMQYIMQAMMNPAAFVKQYFPDIPENIQSNPNQILEYLQRTRGISNQQIQQAQQMAQQINTPGAIR